MVAGKLSRKGQVTIPKAVREALELEPGDLVAYEITAAGVMVRKVDPFDHAFHAAVGATLDEWQSAEDDDAFRPGAGDRQRVGAALARHLVAAAARRGYRVRSDARGGPAKSRPRRPL